MALYRGGPLTQFTAFNAGVIPNDVFGVAINWFVNRTPLIPRLPKLPTGAPRVLGHQRQLPAAIQPAGGQLHLRRHHPDRDRRNDLRHRRRDPGRLRVHARDGHAQRRLLGTSSSMITVQPAYAGTTAASHTNGVPVYLVSNSRTGAEINVTSVSRIPQAVTQYCQTVQHAYQVGGALQADANYVTGFATPLDRDRMLAMQHVMDDFESAVYYGKGVQIAATATRPMMKGIGNLIQTNSVTAPINAAAYKPSDLVRDTLQACFNGGGNPTVLLVSTDFLSGFAVWGHAAMRLNAGSNVFGTPIDLFEAPFLSGISIIPAPLLRPGTVICLSDPEARIRLKRPMIDKPRGSRGDAFEGDIIMEGAIELDNEAHHAWVTGVTAFAAA